MKRSIHLSLLSLCAFSGLFLASGCGDAPRPAASTPSPAPRPSAGAGGELPAGHPPIADPHAQRPTVDDPSVFAGRAVLEGDIASAQQGRIMITLRQTGQRMPLWAYVVDVADPNASKLGLQPAADGKRELLFALNKDTTIIPSPLPKGVELEVEVRYDIDGNVDTRDDFFAATTPAKPGDTDLVLVLSKAAQGN